MLRSVGICIAEVENLEYQDLVSDISHIQSENISASSSSSSRSLKGYIESISCVQNLKGLGESSKKVYLLSRNPMCLKLTLSLTL